MHASTVEYSSTRLGLLLVKGKHFEQEGVVQLVQVYLFEICPQRLSSVAALRRHATCPRTQQNHGHAMLSKTQYLRNENSNSDSGEQDISYCEVLAQS
jgi:hypothetical protein